MRPVRTLSLIHIFAFQPGHPGGKAQNAGRQIAGQGERNKQDGLALVTIGGHFGRRKLLREWPLDFTGGKAGRQRPNNLGWRPGVAGIFPVGMPAGFHLHVDASPNGGAGFGGSSGRCV